MEISKELLSEVLGEDPKLVLARIREQDMTFNEVIRLPQNFRHHKIIYNGEEYNLKSLCTVLNLNYDTVHKRIEKYGYSLQIATGCINCKWIRKEINEKQLQH